MKNNKRSPQNRSANAAVITATCLVLGASGKVVADIFIVPSVTVAVVHDDNVFVTATSPEQDTLTRVTPGLEAGYDGETFTANVIYGRDMEKYNEFDELDSSSIREFVDLAMRYAVSPRLSLTLAGNYMESRVPSDLNPTIGLGVGRIEGERTSLTTGIEYRFSETLAATLEYTGTKEELSEGIGNESNTIETTFAHDLSARNQLLYGYRYTEFEFDNGVTQEVHVPRIGWQHAFSNRTSMTMEAGPLITDDQNEVYFNALLTRTHNRGSITVGVARDVGTVIGEAGVVEVDSFNVGLLHRLSDDFEINANASYGEVTRSDRELNRADVIRAAVEARYAVNDAVSLFASYNYSKQEAAGTPELAFEIPRHVVALGVTFRIPHRSSTVSQNR